MNTSREASLHDRPVALVKGEEEAAEDVVDGDVVEWIQGLHDDRPL
jgi:hypothetical protein